MRKFRQGHRYWCEVSHRHHISSMRSLAAWYRRGVSSLKKKPRKFKGNRPIAKGYTVPGPIPLEPSLGQVNIRLEPSLGQVKVDHRTDWAALAFQLHVEWNGNDCIPQCSCQVTPPCWCSTIVRFACTVNLQRAQRTRVSWYFEVTPNVETGRLLLSIELSANKVLLCYLILCRVAFLIRARSALYRSPSPCGTSTK
jgi:hypothetical protein